LLLVLLHWLQLMIRRRIAHRILGNTQEIRRLRQALRQPQFRVAGLVAYPIIRFARQVILRPLLMGSKYLASTAVSATDPTREGAKAVRISFGHSL
jgi:hypothetical protein